MAKKNETEGEQIELIDVGAKNSPILKRLARNLKKKMAEQKEAGDAKQAARAKLLDAIKESGIQLNADGSGRFRCDGVIIEVGPVRDSLVNVKDADKEDADEGENGEQ